MPHILASDYAVDILVKDLHLRHRSRDANCVGNFEKSFLIFLILIFFF